MIILGNQPGTPGFMATRNLGAPAMGPNERVVFDGVVFNEGGGYNNTTGSFIAPRTGTYLFTYLLNVFPAITRSLQSRVFNNTQFRERLQYRITSAPANQRAVLIGSGPLRLFAGDDVFLSLDVNGPSQGFVDLDSYFSAVYVGP